MIIGNKAGLKKKSLKYIKLNCSKKQEEDENVKEVAEAEGGDHEAREWI